MGVGPCRGKHAHDRAHCCSIPDCLRNRRSVLGPQESPVPCCRGRRIRVYVGLEYGVRLCIVHKRYEAGGSSIGGKGDDLSSGNDPQEERARMQCVNSLLFKVQYAISLVRGRLAIPGTHGIGWSRGRA